MEYQRNIFWKYVVHLKKADTDSIYSALVECLKDKELEVSRIIGMGFDGASTFSGKKSGVQTRIKKIAPHALFVHCRCHLLQLACVQAVNSTNGIKHIYITLTAFWKFFHYSSNRAESLKTVQQVLNLPPELKIAKPSNTRWLALSKLVMEQQSLPLMIFMRIPMSQKHLLLAKLSPRETLLQLQYLHARLCSSSSC